MSTETDTTKAEQQARKMLQDCCSKFSGELFPDLVEAKLAALISERDALAAQVSHLVMAEADAMALVLSHEGRIAKLDAQVAQMREMREALKVCWAALTQCSPCEDPACAAEQREYIDRAIAACSRVLAAPAPQEP